MCDNLGKYLISDEEEPQPKTRKLKSSTKNMIRKSNFTQVNINIFDKKYKEWIRTKNSKIYEFFKKVQKILNF
jgi:CRISPR/Cas system CMR subunit Cmr6 (Cas7 group RAMP superfamily)